MEELKSEIEKFDNIAHFKDSEGGKLIMKSLVRDMIDGITSMATRHSLMTLQEFISLGAELKSKIDLYDVLVNALGNKNSAQDELEKELNST
jgi:hypothetical protein